MSWPEGYGRRVLDSIDSTSAEAARSIPTLAGPEWIMARHQTEARGRRGRRWINPVGNFSATLVYRPTGSPQEAALRSFIAALALFDAIAGVTGRVDGLAVKWPNDVLLNGGKLAGILLESQALKGGGFALSIGIGVNLVQAPDACDVEEGAVRPVSLLSETGCEVTPEAFLEALADAFAKWEMQFQQFGFAPIREAWLARAARLGEVIRARTGSSEHVGTFETVDAIGQLVLKTSRGRQAIPAADVYF
ncbi:MAG: biotin--[acetyl-CoA-carboxylase] ligase [Rhodobacteraceae bacterium]|nr:biotin--[acetyl-CoA-carboxylase] ligase [Paracoccaceae bacterium]